MSTPYFLSQKDHGSELFFGAQQWAAHRSRVAYRPRAVTGRLLSPDVQHHCEEYRTRCPLDQRRPPSRFHPGCVGRLSRKLPAAGFRSRRVRFLTCVLSGTSKNSSACVPYSEKIMHSSAPGSFGSLGSSTKLSAFPQKTESRNASWLSNVVWEMGATKTNTVARSRRRVHDSLLLRPVVGQWTT